MSAWTEAIRIEAAKLIRRFENYARAQADERCRRSRRTTGTPSPLVCKRPSYWDLADGFNPYLVRSRADRIGHSVQLAIRQQRFSPRTAVIYGVPKASGGTRKISVFQVADNAVSLRIFRSLMRKNRPRMSSRAYAYRDDITVHDAVHYVATELRDAPRLFVAEYDFSKYFDNISHEYLWRIVRDHGFLLTKVEEEVVRSFLVAPASEPGEYREQGGPERDHGVPQGTSISLFLANIAAWELDRALEHLGVSFMRYADDTLIWSVNYDQICRAVDALHNAASRIGAPLNLQKSGGIRLLAAEGAPAEMERAAWVDLLGHRISTSCVSIKPALVERLKSRINNLLYFNLIKEPAARTQNDDRLTGGVDRDYTTLIWQLRRYLYGDISERGLRRLGVASAV